MSAGVSPETFVLRGRRHELQQSTIADDGTFELAIVRSESGEAHGTIALRIGEGALEVLHLWVAVPFRGYGAGSEVAQLVIAAVSGAGIAEVRAWAHPELGLSVYFWIRMGLRPQHGPGPNGGLRFIREVGVLPAG